MKTSLRGKLLEALAKAAAGNSHTSAPAVAVLWPDKERQWEKAVEQLRAATPQLLSFGTYELGTRTGPAVWLKCAIAGLLPEVEFESTPIVYLPGISRAELRAIESCPRDLQPLAELQYRGMFWSQASTKDWTLSAFLSSKHGGLGLDVAQDRATQEALTQAMEAGILLDRPLDEFKARQVNAEWLIGLMAPNPARDLLLWMNDATAAKAQWAGVRWNVFSKVCKNDFGFDPEADGQLVAAEKLAQQTGAWASVAELYRDSYASVPQVYELLRKVQPPNLELFSEPDELSGYPLANEQAETALRKRLLDCAAMDQVTAREEVLKAERDHGMRRTWLWNQMGRAPLAAAMADLAALAELTKSAPVGALPGDLAKSYQETGWRVDLAALRALGLPSSKADIEAVSAAVRSLYLPWLEEAAKRLQNAVKTAGGLPPLTVAPDLVADDAGVCTVFVDGLRFDVAKLLADRLASFGTVSSAAQWTAMPSVTASGKPWCSPVASAVAGASDAVDFEPISGYQLRKLLEEQGIQTLGVHELGEPSGRAWTEAGDLDHYGHAHGIRLARDLDTQLTQVVERVEELCQAGWSRVRIVTDHGWLLMPGGLPKSELAKHQTATRWGRCAVLKDTAHGTPLTFGWDWCKDVQVAYAPGITSFVAGTDYAHGGLSLQESLVPVLELKTAASSSSSQQVVIKSVSWRGLRCTVEVAGDVPGLMVDIRTKPAQASSSLVAKAKAVEAGKASLAVAEDENHGAAAVVVVLSSGGEVVQKQMTTIGG